MNIGYIVTLHVLCMCQYPSAVTSAVTTLADLDAVATTIVDEYFEKQGIVPVQDITTKLTVTVDLSLVAITDVGDEENYVEISGFLTVSWTEGRYTPIVDDVYTMLAASSMWTPTLLLINSLSSAAQISAGSTRIIFNFKTAGVVWRPWFVGKAACDIDLTYFPYDQHTCTITFSVLGQVKLAVAQANVNTAYYVENNKWTLVDSETNAYTSNAETLADFKLTIKRKPKLKMLLTVAPVTLISILHLCAFLIPGGSGERVKFSIGCLLLFAILLVILKDELPATSSTIPYLLYYIFGMFVLNSLNVFLAIVSTNLSNMADTKPVPVWLSVIASCLACRSSKYRKSTRTRPQKNTVSTTTTTTTATTPTTAWDDDPDDEEFPQGTERNLHPPLLTWETVQSVFDAVAVFMVLALELTVSLVFLLIVANNGP